MQSSFLRELKKCIFENSRLLSDLYFHSTYTKIWEFKDSAELMGLRVERPTPLRFAVIEASIGFRQAAAAWKNCLPMSRAGHAREK